MYVRLPIKHIRYVYRSSQLLLPEIRNTVSNLSQAIRFLVDNDFLENVELKPGDAERQKNRIQVLSSTESHPDVP